MTLAEAKQILGLAEGDDPVSKIADLDGTRERLAEMVRQAPNEAIAVRYQEELQEFDQALASVREEVERIRKEKVAAIVALAPSSASGQHLSRKRVDFHQEIAKPAADLATVPKQKAPIPKRERQAVDEISEHRPVRKGRKGRFLFYTLLFLILGGAGGAWLYYHIEADREVKKKAEIAFLEVLGAKLVEGRSWEEARRAYDRIARLSPGSQVATLGQRSIEFGMRQEQEQFVGYWSGEALAAFEAGRLDDASDAADKVLKRYPSETKVSELLQRIESARVTQVKNQWSEAIQSAIEARIWEQAESGLAALAQELPGDELITTLGQEISKAKAKQKLEFERARELLAAAKLRDQGAFDAMALEWMREAVALAPNNAEVRSFYEKIASYTRTIRVPEDAATLEAALADARDRDRIVLGEGTFAGGVSINVAVQLEGAGEGKTILESEATEAPVITFGAGAKEAVVTGLLFRKTGFDPSSSRFPGVQLRGAEVSFSDCVFVDASGHGLEVIEGGAASALRCTFEGNGWDGAAAHGKNSRLDIRECQANSNFGHGFEIWDGGAAAIADSVSKRNSRSGILVDSASEGIQLMGNEVFGNREYGIVLAAGASGRVRGNSVYANLPGGMVVRFASISMVVEKNRMEKNTGTGLVLEQGLRPDIYDDNVVRLNTSGNVKSAVRFSSSQ